MTGWWGQLEVTGSGFSKEAGCCTDGGAVQRGRERKGKGGLGDDS